MNAKHVTLSQALAEHMQCSDEKTLAQINENVFVREGMMAGMGYLLQLQRGYGTDPLYSEHETEGAALLAKHLMANRPQLGLEIYIVPPSPPKPTMLAQTTRPFRKRHIRKPRPPRGKHI